jgi:hypothetical protein
MNRLARVTGERFDADQIQWACDECGLDQYSCSCECEAEEEPTCQCGELLDANSFCKSCEEYWPPKLTEAEATSHRRAA